MTRRLMAIAGVTAAVLLCGYLLAVAVTKSRAATAPHFLGTTIQNSPPEPKVELLDQDGDAFHLSDKRGSELVLFFGYAHCPDICPTTFSKLAQAYRTLGEARTGITIAFVTVDPSRDSAGALRRYVDLFNSHFYGLTGSQDSLNALYMAYHVWHQRLPSNSAAGYLMAHSSAIYMLDRNGRLRVMHDWDDPVDAVVHDMRILLQ